VSRTGGIARSVDTPYRGLLIRAGADKRTGRAFFKFATKLFSERAGHASTRAREDCVDGSDRGGMGAASCAVADLNADHKPDIVCISSTTLKWYENTASRK
jgi:hypothetical protein